MGVKIIKSYSGFVGLGLLFGFNEAWGTITNMVHYYMEQVILEYIRMKQVNLMMIRIPWLSALELV